MDADNAAYDAPAPAADAVEPSRDGECRRCGKEGHWARECPDAPASGGDGACFSCGQPGHMARNCPQREAAAASRVLAVLKRAPLSLELPANHPGLAAVSKLFDLASIAATRPPLERPVAPPLLRRKPATRPPPAAAALSAAGTGTGHLLHAGAAAAAAAGIRKRVGPPAPIAQPTKRRGSGDGHAEGSMQSAPTGSGNRSAAAAHPGSTRAVVYSGADDRAGKLLEIRLGSGVSSIIKTVQAALHTDEELHLEYALPGETDTMIKLDDDGDVAMMAAALATAAGAPVKLYAHVVDRPAGPQQPPPQQPQRPPQQPQLLRLQQQSQPLQPHQLQQQQQRPPTQHQQHPPPPLQLQQMQLQQAARARQREEERNKQIPQHGVCMVCGGKHYARECRWLFYLASPNCGHCNSPDHPWKACRVLKGAMLLEGCPRPWHDNIR